MKVEGAYSFNASRETTWESLQAPETLASCIPGCERFEAKGDDTYEVQLTLRLSAVSGAYTGRVSVTDKSPPDSYTMLVEGNGSGGSIKATATMSFVEEDGVTHVKVVGDAQVSGVVARVGQRLMGGVSKMLMNQFFDCLKHSIEGR